MRIAYMGSFPFPGSTAATHRVRGIARALTIAGHDVTVVPLVHGDEGPVGDLAVDRSLAREARGGTVSNAGHILLGGGSAIDWLEARFTDYDLAILYGTPAAILVRYLRASRRASPRVPPLLLDVVEWYDYGHRPGGRFGPFAAEHALAMNTLAPRVGSAICISTYLEAQFAGRGCRTVVVPPLFEPLEVADPVVLDPAVIHIGYAGAPGAKDGPGLVNLLASTEDLPADLRSRVHIEVVGLDRAQGERLAGRTGSAAGSSADPGNVKWHGRLPSPQAQAVVAACDFTFLQRPVSRFAMAGFPTKVVESLMLGTPVVTNHTSDLAAYVRDGENGVILGIGDGSGRPAVDAALRRILRPGFELRQGRDQIMETSRALFGPGEYAEQLDRIAIETAGRSRRVH